jgi:hypothetical protein
MNYLGLHWIFLTLSSGWPRRCGRFSDNLMYLSGSDSDVENLKFRFGVTVILLIKAAHRTFSLVTFLVHMLII